LTLIAIAKGKERGEEKEEGVQGNQKQKIVKLQLDIFLYVSKRYYPI
jgi:hypothetical protein